MQIVIHTPQDVIDRHTTDDLKAILQLRKEYAAQFGKVNSMRCPNCFGVTVPDDADRAAIENAVQKITDLSFWGLGSAVKSTANLIAAGLFKDMRCPRCYSRELSTKGGFGRPLTHVCGVCGQESTDAETIVAGVKFSKEIGS